MGSVMVEKVETPAVPEVPAREVYTMEIIGQITEPGNRELLSKVRANTKRQPFHIYTCGPGGGVNAGFVLMDVIASMDTPVVYFVQGFCASMCSAFIQDRDFLRLCYPHARFMFHSSQVTLDGTYEEIDNQYKVTKLLDSEIIQVVADAIGIDHKEAKRKLFAFDRFMMPKELMMMGDNGGVDGIILTSLGDHKYLCETRGGLKVIDTFIHQRSDIADLPVWVKP